MTDDTDDTNETPTTGDPEDRPTLTRRDALAALTSAGVAVGTLGAGAYRWSALRDDDSTPDDAVFDADEREILLALAHTVYPSDLDGVEEFVETFVVGRARDRTDYARGMREALATLDDRATKWFDAGFADLSPADRDDVLRQLGVDTADPDPDGVGGSRVRFYLVNELLYAIYTSPTGGKLVGIENPQGYPGGTDSYQHGPR